MSLILHLFYNVNMIVAQKLHTQNISVTQFIMKTNNTNNKRTKWVCIIHRWFFFVALIYWLVNDLDLQLQLNSPKNCPWLNDCECSSDHVPISDAALYTDQQ